MIKKFILSMCPLHPIEPPRHLETVSIPDDEDKSLSNDENDD